MKRGREKRCGGVFRAAMLVTFICSMAGPLWGQPKDPMRQPTEYGMRFTPEMAQSISRLYVNEVFVPRYKLPEEKIEEATEAMAHRFMEAAHSVDDPQKRDALEEMYAGFMGGIADQHGHGFTPKMGKAVSAGVKPLIPAIRGLIKNVGQDVRPMLPMKQQLKLGADLLSAGTALDAFEDTLDRWERGEVEPFGNPFKPRSEQVPLDENGESEALRKAREIANRALEQREWIGEWENYVEQAVEYYQLDESQTASAQSVLRDILEQENLVYQKDNWRNKIYRNRLWNHLIMRLVHAGENHPVRYAIENQYQQLLQPIENLGSSLRRKIDQIPTGKQKRAAQAWLEQRLEEQGFAEGSY
jgi:hypothetical protein